MSVFITGDIHGNYDIRKLNAKNFDADDLTKDDYLIICGDFGVVWDYRGQNDEEKYWLDWLENKPWTTLFVDGNHECFSRLNNEFPIEEWHDGNIHKIRDSIYHLMRGQVFDIEGHTFFTMGGAPSHDVEYRTKGKSWWPEEVPSQEERDAAIKKLEEYNWKVDYVITHDAPSRIADILLTMIHDYSRDTNEYTDWLQYIDDNLEFKRWFFGHYHIDKNFNNGKYNEMYYNIEWLL